MFLSTRAAWKLSTRASGSSGDQSACEQSLACGPKVLRGLVHQELAEPGQAVRATGLRAPVQERSTAGRLKTEHLLRERGLVGAEHARGMCDGVGAGHCKEALNAALTSEARQHGGEGFPEIGRRGRRWTETPVGLVEQCLSDGRQALRLMRPG